MTRIRQALGVAVLWLAAASAHPQLSSTLTATSDYDFRGFSQSAKDPALQGSLDYAFANGFALGAWASNVDFGRGVDADVELDYYASYTHSVSEAVSWSLGATLYSYPGSSDVDDYPEFYIGLGSGKFSFKQWYSDDYLKADAGSAWYSEGNATFALRKGFALLAHAGYSWGDYWDAAGGALLDYSVGLGYDWNNFNFSARFGGTDASGAQKVTADAGNNEPRVTFTVATTLPWSGAEK